MNIVIIDDDVFILKLLKKMLAKLNFDQVFCFDSGPDALVEIDSAGVWPDVILLDINMPGMDGIEFLRHIAKKRYFTSLIVISGENDRTLAATESLIKAQGLKMLGILRKPPSLARLAALLDNWEPQSATALSKSESYPPEAVHAAIAGNQLVNYYQPKVEISSGKIIGVEALVRWNHDSHGIVFPDKFVPIAEDHGMIGDLTRTVLENALLQVKRWSEQGLDLKVAVNISMDDAADLGFADFVIDAVQSVELPADFLMLEVTESRLMPDLAKVLDVLTRLCLKRFRLSIDDFGTGYSSLAQLRDLPFDEIKLDRSFIHGAWKDPNLRAIVESNLNLAKQLGLKVVAEGVEDIEDWSFLRGIGCPVAQGFFIAKPMPADELLPWVQRWQTRLQDDCEILGGAVTPPS